MKIIKWLPYSADSDKQLWTLFMLTVIITSLFHVHCGGFCQRQYTPVTTAFALKHLYCIINFIKVVNCHRICEKTTVTSYYSWCRVGGRDKYFHCDNCDICLPKSIFDTHKVQIYQCVTVLCTYLKDSNSYGHGITFCNLQRLIIALISYCNFIIIVLGKKLQKQLCNLFRGIGEVLLLIYKLRVLMLLGTMPAAQRNVLMRKVN
jgi:hypothetical protein